MCFVGFSAEIARACFVTGISVKGFRRVSSMLFGREEMGLARLDRMRARVRMGKCNRTKSVIVNRNVIVVVDVD
jgi:hypothetical protein